MKVQSKVIQLTSDQFERLLTLPNKFSEICFHQEKGLYVDLTISVDRSGGNIRELKDFISNVESACNLVGVDINSLSDFSYVYEDSDHETVVQRQYILETSCIREGFLYDSVKFSGIIQSVDYENSTFSVENKNGETKTIGINPTTCHDCRGFVVNWS